MSQHHSHLNSMAEMMICEGEKLDLDVQNVKREARNFLDHKLWTRGYFVSAIRRNEEITVPISRTRRWRTSS